MTWDRESVDRKMNHLAKVYDFFRNTKVYDINYIHFDAYVNKKFRIKSIGVSDVSSFYHRILD